MVVNRDEWRSRPLALPPIVVESGTTRAVMPTDPLGHGTWAAVTDAGLAFALLNGAEAGSTLESARTITPSRGRIIPSLLDCRWLEEVRDRVLALNPRMYRPWRLVVVNATHLFEAESKGSRVRHFFCALPQRFITTSSSLLESEVVEARTQLFRDVVSIPDADAQDRFHAHQWADQKGWSVRMERSDARTVSCSVIEVTSDRVTYGYESLDRAGRAMVDLTRPDVRRGAA